MTIPLAVDFFVRMVFVMPIPTPAQLDRVHLLLHDADLFSEGVTVTLVEFIAYRRQVNTALLRGDQQALNRASARWLFRWSKFCELVE